MRGHPLQELMEEETIYVSWQRVIGVVTWTCNEVLGPRNPNHKGWISTETLSKIEERKAKKAVVNNSWTRTAKAKAQEECKGVNRNVKMSLKADKRNYLEWGSWRGGPNPISQEIVFFQIPAQIPQSQPVLLKSKSHSHFSIVFFSWIPVPVHKIPFPSLSKRQIPAPILPLHDPLESLAAEAEEAAYHGNMQDLHATIRNLSENIWRQRDRWKTRIWVINI